jgi:hypothetical protein
MCTLPFTVTPSINLCDTTPESKARKEISRERSSFNYQLFIWGDLALVNVASAMKNDSVSYEYR